jgi:hypothetical protein
MQIERNEPHGGAPRYEPDAPRPRLQNRGMLTANTALIALGGILLGLTIAASALGASGYFEYEGPTSSPQRPGVVDGPPSTVDY